MKLEDRLYKPSEAAEIMRLELDTVYKLIQKHEIGFYQAKPGKPIRLSRKHIFDYLGISDEH